MGKKKKDKTFKKMQQQQKQSEKSKQKAKKYVFWTLSIIVVITVIWLISQSGLTSRETPSSENRPFVGPENAEIVFLEFGCYTCPFTKQFNLQVMNQLIDEYSDRVKFVYRSVPITQNIGSELAAQAGKCAFEQGDFFEYSNYVFETNTYTRDNLVGFAREMNFNIAEFEECLDSQKYRDEVREDIRAARRAGVTITPTVFINDVRITGVHDISLYRRVLNDMLAE